MLLKFCMLFLLECIPIATASTLAPRFTRLMVDTLPLWLDWYSSTTAFMAIPRLMMASPVCAIKPTIRKVVLTAFAVLSALPPLPKTLIPSPGRSPAPGMATMKQAAAIRPCFSFAYHMQFAYRMRSLWCSSLAILCDKHPFPLPCFYYFSII